tara:strand:+ start:1299 stop:1622 length:324 start_codon:yes stop_codon:yes gene_type:complete
MVIGHVPIASGKSSNAIVDVAASICSCVALIAIGSQNKEFIILLINGVSPVVVVVVVGVVGTVGGIVLGARWVKPVVLLLNGDGVGVCDDDAGVTVLGVTILVLFEE